MHLKRKISNSSRLQFISTSLPDFKGSNEIVCVTTRCKGGWGGRVEHRVHEHFIDLRIAARPPSSSGFSTPLLVCSASPSPPPPPPSAFWSGFSE
ncbi:hypothetical protein CDAR_169791 [Caerostris darwini]|uniref:Uncharacterized protein n=1 Tax=Caerostris darwini TaxID=1538125 RepID=A0AAV4TSZ1_9ARAC|nr:hypothetical protein CDAR_169791 [Caerostris darwini]